MFFFFEIIFYFKIGDPTSPKVTLTLVPFAARLDQENELIIFPEYMMQKIGIGCITDVIFLFFIFFLN